MSALIKMRGVHGRLNVYIFGKLVMYVKRDGDGGLNVYLFGLRLLRLRMRGMNRDMQLQQRVLMLEKTMDITKLPSARGWLRDLQLANLAILREIDRVCSKCGITYWLDSGSLLGAVRHEGYIPWDDDVDIGMMRQDLERFKELFERECREGYYLELYFLELHLIVKVRHRAVPHCFVDIFVFDYYNRRIESVEERMELTQWVREQQFRFPIAKTREGIEAYCASWRDEKLLKGRLPNPEEKPDIFFGIEFLTSYPRSFFFEYETMFPTRKIRFEGYEFSAPQRPHRYLTYSYGNYMSAPSKMANSHVSLKNIPLADIIRMQDFVENEGVAR